MTRGFTLIETIMYLALLSVLMGGAITMFYVITSTVDSEQDEVTVSSEGSFVIEKINAFLDEAVHLEIDTSSLMVETEEGSSTVSLDDGRVWILRDGEEAPITSSEVTVTELTFTPIVRESTVVGIDVVCSINDVAFTTRRYFGI